MGIKSKKFFFISISNILVIVILSGCAVGKTLKKPDDIKATKDSNIVFMGHSVVIPDPRVKDIDVICTNPEFKPGALQSKSQLSAVEKTCFNLKLSKNAYTNGLHIGAAPYKLKFGEYTITDIQYTVKTGTVTTTSCSSSGCYPTTTAIKKKVRLKTDYNLKFKVSATQAPYIGRIAAISKNVKLTNSSKKLTESSAKQVKVFDVFDKDLSYIKNADLKAKIRDYISH